MRRIILFITLSGLCGAFSAAQETAIITDADIAPGDTVTLTANTEWILDGYVYVEEGSVLVVEPGTVVRGRLIPSNGVDLTSALIISRGGKIIAEGTKEFPIIFTAELDDLSVTDDFTAEDNQFWGGLLIMGRAPIGEDVDVQTGELYPVDNIEGIPSTESRARYGGEDPEDNSGILKYVSIRHGGSVLGADNEINGLTLGGVGRGTTIEYVEVFANKDDGFEIFGGTVNAKHLVVAFCGDDAYDFDESWDGALQFLLSIQLDMSIVEDGDTEGFGDHAIEYDGPESANKEPKTVGRIYNGTFIGAGLNSMNNLSSDGLILRLDAAVQIWNSIFTEMSGYGFRVEDTSLDRLMAGESGFFSNIVHNIGTLAQGNNQTVLNALAAGNTQQVDPELAGLSRIPDEGLDPRPNGGSPTLSGATWPPARDLDFIDQVNYRGAFNNVDNWALGWTAVDAYGYFGDLVITSAKAWEKNGFTLNVYPNPVRGIASIAFELLSESRVNLDLIDLTGKIAASFISQWHFPGGKFDQLIDVSGLPQGMYIARLKTDEVTLLQRIVINN